MSATTKTYQTIIADDDEIDRLTAISFCRKYPFLQVSAVAASGDEALQQIQQIKPDLLILDIDMPGTNGMELRKKATAVPACIFITAHPEYAVESFELDVLDYLVKPIKADRFEAAMNRLQQYFILKEKAAALDYTLGGDTIFIKEGYNQVKLAMHNIMYLEALKDYTSIVTPQKKYCVLGTLGNLLEQSNFKNFVRIHRSYAVQKNFVTKLAPNELFINDINLPVGRTYKTELESLFG